MTQTIPVKAFVADHAEADAELVARMGAAVVRQWGALPTDVKALIREQAIVAEVKGFSASPQMSSRIDAFLRNDTGK